MSSPSLDLEYSIEKIDNTIDRHDDALYRMLKGPIDIRGGGGVQPATIAQYGHQHRLLQIDDGDERAIVGYLRFRLDEDQDNKNRVVITEFEIFREHRHRGYGSSFAHKALIYNDYNAPADAYVDLEEMNTEALGFWVKAWGLHHFVDMVENISLLESKEEGIDCQARLDKWCQELKNDGDVKELRQIMFDWLTNPNETKDIEDIIYESDVWKRIIGTQKEEADMSESPESGTDISDTEA